jgi:DnaJ-domain-containing protein 1
MHLPGRLRSTTLGDMLGSLHRARASGTLELVEDRGRTHRVHLRAGLVTAVELDGAGSSLAEVLRKDQSIDDDVLRRSLLRAMASRRLHGEVLIQDFRIAPEVVGRALRRQVLLRLAVLERVTDARVHFSAAVRAPRGALEGTPLEAREFLAGRRRARDRHAGAHAPHPERERPPYRDVSPRAHVSASHLSAARVLGVAPGADPDEIKRAYRRLAKDFHPDLHPGASEEERRTLQDRFAEVTAAYRALVA